MRMNSSRSFQRKGMARVGLVLGRCCWAAGGLQRGLSGQVRQVSFFSIFFLFLFLLLYIFYFNSYLNTILFADICNYANPFKI
jgi:hypothetical protein